MGRGKFFFIYFRAAAWMAGSADTYDGAMRATIVFILVVLALLGGCTKVTPLKNAKSGETARCGGEIWSPTAGATDEHCLKYFHQQGFDPVPP